jgi:hypothetical protein
MTEHYQRCKKAIYTYKSKNTEKIREYNNQYCKNYYKYQKELQEFMNILLDDPPIDKNLNNSIIYYNSHKKEILEKKRLAYQKKKLLLKQSE